MSDLPIVMTLAGPVPTPPQTLRANLVASATLLAPGLTTDLPGSLIEDIASTDVGALIISDSAFVELVNSVTPFGANEFILNQLGQQAGVPKGIGSNGSALLTFTGTAGYAIPKGFTVGDGTHQFVVQDGAIVNSGGTVSGVFAVAVQAGSFPIPANSITTVSTSLPIGVVLTVTNPIDGIAAIAPQTVEQYRAQVLQGEVATAQGYTAFLKTLLGAVSGVDPRLIAVPLIGGKYVVVVGGGDPYAVAGAIFLGTFNILSLGASVLSVTNVSAAAAGVITTDMPHGFTSGQNVTIAGVTGTGAITAVNGTHVATVLTDTTFSFPVSTAGGGYVSGGVVTPNLRNQLVSIDDYPDTYPIPFVTPLPQVLTLTLTWNTIAPNFTSDAGVASLGNSALYNYINSIPVGQPFNLFEAQQVFLSAISGLLDPTLVSRMVFAVDINGNPVSPTAGTGIIPGFSLSYFTATTGGISIVRG